MCIGTTSQWSLFTSQWMMRRSGGDPVRTLEVVRNGQGEMTSNMVSIESKSFEFVVHKGGGFFWEYWRGEKITWDLFTWGGREWDGWWKPWMPTERARTRSVFFRSFSLLGKVTNNKSFLLQWCSNFKGKYLALAEYGRGRNLGSIIIPNGRGRN